MADSVSRRTFVQSAAIAGFVGLTGLLPADLLAQSSIEGEPDPDSVLDHDEGEVYLIGERQGRVTIKVSKRQHGIETMSLLTEDIVPGDGIPVHKHGAEDELIFIERGSGILTFGDDEFPVSRGSATIAPRGVWHGLRNEGDELLRMVFSYSPAGFEDYFRAIGVRPDEPGKELTAADWARINKEFGVVYR